MKSYRNDDLIRLLADGQADLRMLALHLLCEGYAVDPAVFDAVVQGWERWGVERTFSEFPMLTYFPVPASSVDECCRRAAEMVQGRKLVDPVTRCAGKIVEHLMCLSPHVLEPHLSLIAATTQQSKIFFRVDVNGLRERIAFSTKSADELAGELNQALAVLMDQPDARQAVHRGLHALEALRAQYPDYMDLGKVFDHPSSAEGARAISFQLTLQSLIQREQVGTASLLARHLSDKRESVFPNVVEALVRLGTAEAAEAFVETFVECPNESQRWIARGLQRIRVAGLSDRIAVLRNSVTDPALWLMLLIAEVRQFDATSSQRIVGELARLKSFSDTLIDTLSIYARLNEHEEGARQFQQAFMDYIQRSNEALGKLILEEKAGRQQDGSLSNLQIWQQSILRYRENH